MFNKAAITGVDENGNQIGAGERILRGGMVLPIAKPVKGVKMVAKYGDDVLAAGKNKLDDVTRNWKKTACACPKKVNNINQFFDSSFGQNLKKRSHKTSVQYDGQSIYKVTQKTDNPYLKKGDGYYLDALHKDHLEVIDKRGKVKAVLNFDGSLNKNKTKQALQQGRKVKGWK